MKKQKQQVISRFFAPKSQTNNSSSSSSSPQLPISHQTPPPKITATVTFSPAKRLLASQLTPPKPNKTPKLSSYTPNPSLHQKFLQKLLEPSENEEFFSQMSKSNIANPKYTPLEQQVLDLKIKYPDVLLMVEVGYKYRFFGEDAEIAAKILGIFCHMDHNFMTASIPTFRLNFHVRRLVSAGYKVGVVKQTETAAIKSHGANKLGPFCRGLSALYTKATLEAAEDVGGGEEGCGSCSNYLVCVVDEHFIEENPDSGLETGFDVRVGIVAVEISTGDVVHGEFNDNFMRAGLEAVLLSMSPAELLLGDPLSKQTEKLLLAYAGPSSNVRVERVSRGTLKDGGALAEVISLYENTSEDNSVIQSEQSTEVTYKGNHDPAIEGILSLSNLSLQSLALTIRHLKQFGLEKILCLGSSFRPFSSNMEMTLSANTIRQLEVLKNNSDGSEIGSLIQCMNHTLTKFGSRLLRHWVTHPLCDKKMICARLAVVSEIAESMGSSTTKQDVQHELNGLLSSVLSMLGRSPDIQRGITRIFHRTATASEFIAVIQAILLAAKQLQLLHIEENDINNKKLHAKSVINSDLLRKLIMKASSSSVIANSAKILSSLNKEAADKKDLLNLFIISPGQFTEVTSARTKVQLAMEKFDLLLGLYRKQLHMPNLEFTSVSGSTHLIEIPLNVKVPSDWVKVNSTKKMIRYYSPEVMKALDQLTLANEELNVVCRATWDNFLREFKKYYAEFQSTIQAIAALDCLHSLAILSRNKNYACPVFVDDNEPVQIHICSGRHPVLDVTLQDNFVPNDTKLHAEGEYCQIVTGPNMGGKSCYIRQVALIALMAQVGSFVPAKWAKLHVLDGIHTRMGASDSIQQGRSTFLEEVSEASHILHNCTSRSLVIIDELGRGTSTHDGVAIAYATLHHLLRLKRCMVLFVTHYPKIIDRSLDFPDSVGAYHVSYLTTTNRDKSIMGHEDITYLYKLVPGVSEKSFGFKVAQLAQLPSSLIHRAIVMAAKFDALVRNRAAQTTALEASIMQDCKFGDFRDFYSNLKFALEDNDLQLLIHCRRMAKDVMAK